MTYPHKQPTSWQISTTLPVVEIGAEFCNARGVMHLCYGPVRPMSDIALAHREANEFLRMFKAAPMHQWGCVAIAAQGIRAEYLE